MFMGLLGWVEMDLVSCQLSYLVLKHDVGISQTEINLTKVCLYIVILYFSCFLVKYDS